MTTEKAMSEQAAMTIEQAIEFAREWQKGLTVYPGAMGWRVVCMVLADEVERLRSQLPEGMKHCTILFKECEKGHGWLTASNWVQHECATCERDELRRQNDDLILKQFDHIGSGNKAVRRIKAAAVREACDKVLADYRAVSFDKNENLYLNVIALRDYANQIEGGA